MLVTYFVVPGKILSYCGMLPEETKRPQQQNEENATTVSPRCKGSLRGLDGHMEQHEYGNDIQKNTYCTFVGIYDPFGISNQAPKSFEETYHVFKFV